MTQLRDMKTIGDDMKKETINTELGTLNFDQRGKRGTWWIDIVFTNLNELPPKDRRLRCSTGTNKLKLAQTIGQKEAERTYKERCAGVIRKRTMNPSRYILEKHIPYLESNIGLALDKKCKKLTTKKAHDDIHTLLKWFVPFLKGKKWEYLETTRFGHDMVQHLRKNNVSDATISTYKGMLNRMLRQAEIDAHITRLPTYPTLNQKIVNEDGEIENSFAIATHGMIKRVEEHLINKVESTSHAGFKRSYTQALSLYRIWCDTGIRPWTAPSLRWCDIEDQGDMIIIRRREKGKRYHAQGSAITRNALRDLRKMYFAEGTNINKQDTLPLIHHHKNSRFAFQQIDKFHATITKALKECGWFDMADVEGRRYRNHSIRKWHINAHIDAGESPFDIAKRVGHTYATLELFYLNKKSKQKVKADIWNTNAGMEINNG